MKIENHENQMKMMKIKFENDENKFENDENQIENY